MSRKLTVDQKDALQWIIDECYASGQALNPEHIVERLLLLNIVALHSTSLTAYNLVLDLASTDPSQRVIERLRDECQTALQESGA